MYSDTHSSKPLSRSPCCQSQVKCQSCWRRQWTAADFSGAHLSSRKGRKLFRLLMVSVLTALPPETNGGYEDMGMKQAWKSRHPRHLQTLATGWCQRWNWKQTVMLLQPSALSSMASGSQVALEEHTSSVDSGPASSEPLTSKRELEGGLMLINAEAMISTGPAEILPRKFLLLFVVANMAQLLL